MTLHRYTFPAMGGEQELLLEAPDDAAARAAIARATAEVARIEAKYSRYRADSLVARINDAAGGAPVSIDPETAALFDYADQCWRQSGGRFDITSGVLRRCWDFRAEAPRVPDAAEVARVLARVGWDDVERDAHAIRLPRAGMEIDLGGLGKEYAADRVAAILREAGIASGLVNLGGDVRAIGVRPDGQPWQVGIRDPRSDGAAIATLEVADGAVATSGDYERYFEIGGRRYCHILDPRTGWPVEHWQSISVASTLCVAAGSCATIAMLLGADAPAFLLAQGVTWLGVGPDGAITGSDG